MLIKVSVDSKKPVSPDVFSFLDFRHYLKSYIEYKNLVFGGYSNSRFARRLGVSRTYLTLILNGKRKISDEMAECISKTCGLVPMEHDYFVSLVRWNQEDQEEFKQILWKKVVEHLPKDHIHMLEQRETHILHHWFIFGLLSLMEKPDFVLDYTHIRAQLFNQVTETELVQAVQELARQNFISINGSEVRVNTKKTFYADDASPQLIREYHTRTIPLGLEAVQHIDPSLRDVSSCALVIDQDKLPIIKEKIRELRELLVDLSVTRSGSGKVYYFNAQFFPLAHQDQKDEG